MQQLRKLLAGFIVFILSFSLGAPANATNFTTAGWQSGFTATITSQGFVGGDYQIVATWTNPNAILLLSNSPTSGFLGFARPADLYQCDSATISIALNDLSTPSGCLPLSTISKVTTLSGSGAGNTLTTTYTVQASVYSNRMNTYVIPSFPFKDSANNVLQVPTGSGGTSGGSDSDESQSPPPSAKIPGISEFSGGSMLVSPGTNAILTGSRLNCTTSVSVNDKPTTFTYQTLPTGEGQLSIAMPSDLAPGKHRLSMDSCGGNVVFDNILMVSKPEAKLELTMTTAIERGLALVKLRAFVRENRADYNTVECVADAANPTQKKHATQLVDRFCKRAFSLLASPKEHSTLLKSDNQQNSIKLTVTLSNR